MSEEGDQDLSLNPAQWQDLHDAFYIGSLGIITHLDKDPHQGCGIASSERREGRLAVG